MSLEGQGAGGTPKAASQERGPFHIFINYRREETAAHAGRLYDALSERFGDDHVFMDIDAIDPGEDFAQVVEQSVGSCDVLIALIGRGWVAVTDSDGRRRLDKPHDWVRLEIQTALKRKDTRVIPTLVQGAEMPGPDELPEPLQKLAHRNAVELSDGRWHFDVGRLIKHLEDLAGPRAHTTQPQAEAGEQPARVRRRRWLVPALVGAGLLLLGALAAVLVLSRGNKEAEAEHYNRQIEALLTHSAKTRGDLGGLIRAVDGRTTTREEALSQIDRIIGQRTNLADSLPVDPPTSFRHAQDRLHNSIVASRKDDEAVRRWIVAVYDRPQDAPQLQVEFNRLSAVATRKKEEFLVEYDKLRDQSLGLPPLTVRSY